MTNEEKEILTKAMKKAYKNGFRGTWNSDSWAKQPKEPSGSGIACEANSMESERDCVYTTIFSHDFAKAIWGEYDKEDLLPMIKIKGDFINTGIVEKNGLRKWQTHLQQMVLEEEPIKYLKQFLDEKKE